MPSESVCYPAKLSHRHIMNLLGKRPDFIWMPCSKLGTSGGRHRGQPLQLPDRRQLSRGSAPQHRRAARVRGGVREPVAALRQQRASEEAPVLRADEELRRRSGRGRHPLTQAEVDAAVDAAWAETRRSSATCARRASRTLAWMEKTGTHGIVLAGRPYHQDPDQPRHPRAFDQLRARGAHRGLGGALRAARASHSRGRSVDVPHAPLRRGEGRHATARPRPHPAQLVRMRPRRADHRSGAGGARVRGQGVHGSEDRRGVSNLAPRASACAACSPR